MNFQFRATGSFVVAPVPPVVRHREPRRGSARFVLRGKPFGGAAGEYGLGGLRFVGVVGRLRELPVILEEPLARERALEPVQELGGRINLVVVLAVREDGHLVEVLVEPRRRLGDMHKVLDHRGLRVHPHDLVAVRLIPRDTVVALGDQLLDQLGARRLVLDQHFGRAEQMLLLAHGALERGIFEPLPEYRKEEEILETKFKVTLREGKYTFDVTSQKLKEP